MKVTLLKILSLAFFFLLVSCDEDEIGINIGDTTYITGGSGATIGSGAIQFKLDIPGHYESTAINITLHNNNQQRKYTGSGGYQTLNFSNLSPGIYDYTIEFWGAEYNGGFSSYGQSSFSYNFGSYRNDRESASGTLEVKANFTSTVEVDLD